MTVVDTAARLFVVGAAAAMVGCHAPPDRVDQVDPVALRWLSQDCTTGERARLDTALRNEGRPAESTLIVAFERGPSDAILDEVAADAESEYDEIDSAMAAGRTYGLSVADVAAIRAIPRDAHVLRAREEFERSYKAAALSGLAALSLPRGNELLRRVAADPNSPDREIARAALRRATLSTSPP